MEQTGFILIIVAWGAALASWWLGIVEFIGMWRFWPRVFGTGFLVLQEARSLPLPTLAIGSEFETQTGKFKIVAPQLCFFRWRRLGWPGFDIHTPFLVKGTLRWNDSEAAIEGRIPVSTILFIGAWLIAWTIGSTGIVASKPVNLVGSFAVLFLGWAFTAIICLFSLTVELRRAKRILREFENRVPAPA